MITEYLEFINENNKMKVYKNTDKSQNYWADSTSYTVLKGDELYFAEIKKGKPMRKKYMGRVDPEKYIINGKLVSGQSNKELFIILQNNLKRDE